MLERVNSEIAALIATLSPQAQAMAAGLGGGKMLRAKLLLKIAPHHPDAPKVAAIIELIHAASLLHDDVIDEADTRRGLPSVNAQHGAKSAVMLGDILYSRAYGELASMDPFLIRSIALAVAALSEGELADVRLGESYHENEADYIAMIKGKTAALIEATAVCGAFLAGLPTEPFALFGRNLGLAFQIVDDLLDVTQDEATLGKPAMNDLAEGKMTLPYLFLARRLDAKGRAILQSLHAKRLDAEQTAWVKEALVRHGILEETALYAKQLTVEALAGLQAAGIPEALQQELRGVMDAMTQRLF